jgi:MFS family permease
MYYMERNKRVWVVFVGLCIYYFVAFGLIYNGLGMFLTPISTDLGIPFVQVSMTSTVRILAGMITTAAAGRILPKVDMKWFLSINVVLLIVASFVMGAADNLFHLLLGSALMGFAAGFALYAIVPIVLNQWFLDPTRYVTIATAVGGAGGIIFSPVITAAISSFGWRGAYRMVGILVLVVMLPLALFVIRYSPQSYGLKPYGAEKQKQEKNIKNEKTTEADSAAESGESKRMYLYFLIFFICAAILSGMYGHVASAFWAKGFSDGQVGILTGAYQLGTTVVQLIFGFISIKIGLKKALNGMLPLVIVASVGLIFVGDSMFALTVVLSVLLGVGRAFVVINPLLTRQVYGAKKFTKIYSDLYAVFLIATAVTATLFGAVYNTTGSYNLVYALVAVCTVLEIVLVQLIFKFQSGIRK